MFSAPATVTSPHAFYFYYCSNRLMAVRHGVYKVRFFSEELPHDDYPQTNCAAGGPSGSSVGQSGSPHGEFFQTWGCYGKGIYFHDPPQIFDIESDKSELYNLNGANTSNPKYEAVIEAVIEAVKTHNATLHRGSGAEGSPADTAWYRRRGQPAVGLRRSCRPGEGARQL